MGGGVIPFEFSHRALLEGVFASHVCSDYSTIIGGETHDIGRKQLYFGAIVLVTPCPPYARLDYIYKDMRVIGFA